MSELITHEYSYRSLRWRLLLSTSIAAIIVPAYALAAQADGDSNRPSVWIELGGQLENMTAGSEPYTPAFTASFPSNFFSPENVQKAPTRSVGGEGKILFAPTDSDWVFSASLRFGRSNGGRQRHQQTANAPIPVHFTAKYHYHGGYSYYPYGQVKFENVKERQSETHAVIDFQAGKDVGLGMFGARGTSVVSAGVRFAQFTSKSDVNVSAAPDVQYRTAPISSFAAKYAFKHPAVAPVFHDYVGELTTRRSFKGVGPSLAWNASAPVAGGPDRGEITVDWGVNGAVLFGRQNVEEHHQTTVHTFTGHEFVAQNNAAYGDLRPGRFYNALGNQNAIAQQESSGNFGRSRMAVVPNFGAFAGLSMRYANAKMSFGYRSDFFWDAMDIGIDARKTTTLGFHGPFANVSIGFP